MTDREPLLPDNLPYGERQERRDLAEGAGVDLNPPGKPPAPPPFGNPSIDDPSRVANIDALDELPGQIGPPDTQPATPLTESYRKWQQVAQTSPNMMTRAIAMRFLGQLADRMQPDPSREAFANTDLTIADLYGIEGEDRDEIAAELMHQNLDTVAFANGHLPKRLVDKMFHEDGTIDLTPIREPLEEVPGLKGIERGYVLGIQAGTLFAGTRNTEELRTAYSELTEHTDTRNIGAFIAGMMTGYRETLAEAPQPRQAR